MPTPADLVVGALRPDLEALLHSDDAEVLAHRVQQLDPAGASPEDTERLDMLVTEMVRHRRSWREALARVLTVGLVLALGVDAVLLAACSLEPEVRRWVHLRWITWPPSRGVRHTLVGLVAGSWLAGMAVVLLRADDAVRRARLACRLAAVHQPETWPGLCVPAPYQRLGRRFTYPGGSLVALAVAVLVARLLGWLHPGVVAWVGLSAGVVLGVWLVWFAMPWHRAQRLAYGTLFVERLD